MNIKDIAQLSGVSKSTVSNYLNGRKVSPASAEKIARAIEQTGFVPNLSASRLRSNRSGLIGVMVDGIQSRAVARELTAISSTLHHEGYQPFILIDEHDADNKLEGMRALVQQGVDALIFGTARLLPEHVTYLHGCGVPAIILGQRCDLLPYCKVDDRAVGRLLGDHVVASGAQRVSYLAFPSEDAAAGAERTAGFTDAFVGRDVELAVHETSYSEQSSGDTIDEILTAQPDFVACAADNLCYGVLRHASERGQRVPEDLRLAGVGNYDTSSLPQVSLTSVEVDYEEIGRRVASLSVSLARGEEIPHASTDFAIELCLRASSR